MKSRLQEVVNLSKSVISLADGDINHPSDDFSACEYRKILSRIMGEIESIDMALHYPQIEGEYA